MKGINDRFQDMVRQKDLLDLKENSDTDITRLVFNRHQENWEKQLAGKKPLLILDDCWNENYNDWINPSCPLEAAAPGNIWLEAFFISTYYLPTKCWLHWQWSPLKWLDWVCSPVRVAGKSPLLGEPVPPGSSGDF
ncbi:hypothetical protein CUMW_228550 [Citrus unshiu]|uniref:NB-ARC domain-containing protein n=1 Tax=Citrus unshiu TaxID=55188 RepID=A0A2H5QGN6_CITUN|nr:hypothetical protein CUMW_228550 [Citrus unshiu]